MFPKTSPPLCAAIAFAADVRLVVAAPAAWSRAARPVGELVERRVPPQAHSRPLFRSRAPPRAACARAAAFCSPFEAPRRAASIETAARARDAVLPPFVLLARRELALHARGHRKVVLGPFHGLVLLPLELEGQARVVHFHRAPRGA